MQVLFVNNQTIEQLPAAPKDASAYRRGRARVSRLWQEVPAFGLHRAPPQVAWKGLHGRSPENDQVSGCWHEEKISQHGHLYLVPFIEELTDFFSGILHMYMCSMFFV